MTDEEKALAAYLALKPMDRMKFIRVALKNVAHLVQKPDPEPTPIETGAE